MSSLNKFPLNPSALQKRPQMAIIDCLKSKPQISVTETYQQDKPRKARHTHASGSRLSTQPILPPQSGKAHPQVKKDPKFREELLITPPGLQKWLQIAIINYVENRNHNQSVSEASQQDKLWKARGAR